MIMNPRDQRGFTIVEMLIVVVVMGILAVITIVAYNGVQERANRAILQQDLKSADSQLNTEFVDNNDTFPDELETMRNGQGLSFNKDAELFYTARNEETPPGYCLSAVLGSIAYHIENGAEPREGYCPEHDPNGAAEAPSITTNADSTSQITVHWDAVENAASYKLEWSQNSNFSGMTTVPGITGTSHAVSGLSSGTTYYFRLYAINSFSVESNASNVVSDTTLSPAPAGAPTLTATVNSPSQITLSWSTISGATSYTLHYSTASNFSSFSTVSGLSGTSYAQSGLNAGTRYYFRIFATSPGGNGPNSNAINAITTINAPDSPSVSVTIPGSSRASSSGTWAKTYQGQPTSGTWYYAQASISSSTCASGTTRQQRARIQYNSPTTWGDWTSWTTATTFYAINPSSGYGIRFQAQTRCKTDDYTSSASSSAYGCRWASGSTSCSGF